MYNTKEGKSCVIYIRVSSERQVKGDDKSKGKLETVPEEKAVVQLVFDMFLNRNMGYTAISGYLNRNGYTRLPAKNAIRPSYGEWSSVCRRNGVVASQVEDEVMEYTRKIFRNPQFIKDLQEKVMTAVDMTEGETDITAYKNQLSALQRSRDSLERDIDRIAPDDKYAERRRADMTRRLNDLYDQIYKAEDLLQESMMKKATLESEQMSVQSMIGILSSFDAIYDRMNAAERRDLVKYLISEVELFPREEQKTQKRFVKAIAYKFPIEQKVLTQFDECGASVETVARLTRI